MALVRLEQFYPFPRWSSARHSRNIRTRLELFGPGRAAEHGWLDVYSRAPRESLPGCERPRYVGRRASASPATGSYSIHQKEQAELLAEALL